MWAVTLQLAPYAESAQFFKVDTFGGRDDPFFFLTQKIGELYRDLEISISFLSNISSTNSWIIS